MKTYSSWVKRLGQWHLCQINREPMEGTLCGKPCLGNNYEKTIPIEERTKCTKCFRIMEEKEELK